MKKLGIIQPAKIGDIIICLPIAKYYFDRGYEVIWPICQRYFNMFASSVDYVRFVPTTDNLKIVVEESMSIAIKKNPDFIINLAFGFRGMEDLWYEWKRSNLHFDEYKYFMARVPFSEKWNLKIKRNHEKEKALFQSLNVDGEFLVYQSSSSDTVVEIKWENEEIDMRKIEILDKTDSIFDWIYTIERASGMVLIDSCIVNMVEQLNISVKKRRLKKPTYTREQDYPVLRNEWGRE